MKMRSVKVLRLLQVAVVASMVGLMGYYLRFSPATSFPVFVVGALALVALELAAAHLAERSGEVLEDERVRALAEKCGYRAYQAVSSALGFIVITAYLLPLWTGLQILPEGWAKPFITAIGITVVILISSYYIAYIYYSRRPIEGR